MHGLERTTDRPAGLVTRGLESPSLSLSLSLYMLSIARHEAARGRARPWEQAERLARRAALLSCGLRASVNVQCLTQQRIKQNFRPLKVSLPVCQSSPLSLSLSLSLSPDMQLGPSVKYSHTFEGQVNQLVLGPGRYVGRDGLE